jgi:glycosyltransferase involved in cell wall biosynthesis
MKRPTISVIIPTYNRCEELATVLDAWERQQPEDLPFEVVVVDDGSSDGTAELLAGRATGRFTVRSAAQSNAGPAAARNRGIGMAAGDIVLFSGDDIEPDPSLLAEHLAGHRQAADGRVAILGLTRWPDGVPLTATMRHIDGVGAQQFSYKYLTDGAEYDFRHFYTSNVSLHRGLLALEPDGFSTDFPAAAFEDAEFAYRLAGHGMRIRYRASALAFHHHWYEAEGFFKRQLRCGEMAAILVRKQPQLKKWLGVTPLEWTRIETAGPAGRPRELSMVAEELERWERRALTLARFFDRVRPDAVDALLHPLFEYAYNAGLCDTLFDRHSGRRVKAAEFRRLLPQGVRELQRRAAIAGIPVPHTDAAAIAALATEDGQ